MRTACLIIATSLLSSAQELPRGFKVRTPDGNVIASCTLRGFSGHDTPDISDCHLDNGATLAQLIQQMSATSSARLDECQKGVDEQHSLAMEAIGVAERQTKNVHVCMALNDRLIKGLTRISNNIDEAVKKSQEKNK